MLFRSPGQLLFRQFAEPVQRDRGLRTVHFMAAAKSSDSNPLKASSLDRTHDCVLLFQGRGSILVTGANVNRCVEKVCAGLQSRKSITQVVFVRACHVNPGDTTTVFR